MPTGNPLMFRSRLPEDAFIRLIELYAKNVESYRIAEEIDVSRVTVSRILNAIRRRMATYAPRLEPPGRAIEFSEEVMARAHPRHVRGRRPTSDTAVAGVACGARTVACDLILGFPRTLWRYLDLELGGLETIAAEPMLQGSVALLDLHGFELISLAPPREDGGVRFRGEESLLVEEFADFAQDLLQRARGVPEDKLWLYLAEVEFRFNRRREDLAAVIVDILRMEPLRLSE